MKYSSEITTRFRLVAIGLLIVAVATLLITPQVDFPDSVSNRTISSVSGLGHANGGVVSAVNALTILVIAPIDLAKSTTFRRSQVSTHTNAHYVLIRLCTLRC